MMNRKHYSYRQPHRFRRKKSVLKNKYFWLGILILLVSGGIFYSIYFSNFFHIKEIKIAGNQKVPAEDIQSVVENNIERKVLLFFHSKSVFSANLNEIIKELLAKFPRLSSVVLHRQLPDKLLVEIKERIPFGVWCQGENCYYLDEEGVIFDDNPFEYAMVIKTQNEPPEVFLGQRIVEKGLMEKISKIQKTLKNNMKTEIKEFNIVGGNRLNAKTGEGWEIYFNPADNLDWQLTEIKMVLEKQIPPEKRGNLAYIDLRFSKVYYKFR